MTTIQDKVVVIMGASSGIGEATTKRLAQEGANHTVLKIIINLDSFDG